MSEESKITGTLARFLTDRRDGDFTRVVKTFISGSGEEQFRAFLFALTSAKVFTNLIFDGGEVTASNAVLMKTIETQMAKLREETTSNDSDMREDAPENMASARRS